MGGLRVSAKRRGRFAACWDHGGEGTKRRGRTKIPRRLVSPLGRDRFSARLLPNTRDIELEANLFRLIGLHHAAQIAVWRSDCPCCASHDVCRSG
jgi:hypothetical protein